MTPPKKLKVWSVAEKIKVLSEASDLTGEQLSVLLTDMLVRRKGADQYSEVLVIQKPLDQIQKSDIESLLSENIPEGRTLDYKERLPGSSDGDKKEFLADVSAFANASGGDIVFGVSEIGGIPDRIPGVVVRDADSEILRLDSLVRDGIAPRLSGFGVRSIPGFPSGPVLVVRVPRSWSAPTW